MNDVIAESAGASSGWSKYNATKKKWSGNIRLLANVKGLAHIGPSYFSYMFFEHSRRRDPSNIVSGGVKLVEDSLQEAGLLQNDGWEHVLGYVGYWHVAAHRVGCLVYWGESLASRETMLALWGQELENYGNSNRSNGNGTGNRSHAGHRSHTEQAATGDAPAGSKLG